MAKINILDPSIYNLIVAGEVVERPVSVVKELIENSIDAGAENITIEIKDGGTTFISVSDDGAGIDESDFKSAFLPHATSKITNADDLNFIGTLGFRGEALASIAAVSKVTLTSKTIESDVGTSLTVEGGTFGDITKVSCNKGTTIVVKDLFYCVPARSKFLKKNKSEEQEITNIIIRTILANPNINITYIVDGKKNLSSMGKTEKEALFSVYGKDAVNETIEVKAERENVSVYGFVGKPTFSKSNRTYQTLIVNGRYVINLTVQTAVTNAFGEFLMKRQYPFFVLYLNVPIDEIDVNVHPNKLDVRFLKTPLIYSVVFEAVSRALHNMDYVKEISLGEDLKSNTNVSFASSIKTETSKIDKAGVNLNPFSSDFDKMNNEEKDKMKDIVLDSILSINNNDGVRDNFGLGSKLLERINKDVENDKSNAYNSQDYSLKNESAINEIIGNNSISNGGFETFKNESNNELNESINYNDNNDVFSVYKAETENQKVNNSSFKNENFEKVKSIQEDFAENKMKIVGKFFNTYLAIEWGDNIYLIDQHAAHERIRYEKLKEECESGNLIIQPMLIPFVISLNPEDDQIVKANLDAIRSVGFDIDEFGDRTYKISSIPAIVSDINFNDFFNQFLAEKLNKNKVTKSELVKEELMQMACKSAIKGGDDLSMPEINKLLETMSRENIKLFCPHGRPIVVRITKNEVEKWFKRIV